MKKLKSPQGFTLIELLVVITIIAILAGIAMPAFTEVQTRGAQTKVLNDAKQIYLALRMFSGDYDGLYPSKAPVVGGKLNSGDVAATSNIAFQNLVPNYLPNAKPFYVAKSKWCTPDAAPKDVASDTVTDNLPVGANHFAYVTNLDDTSNPSYPLITDGFSEAGAATGTWALNDSEKGGLWKGKAAIVVRVDGSAKVERTVRTTTTAAVVDKVTQGSDDDTNIFVATGGAWLKSAAPREIKVLNPL